MNGLVPDPIYRYKVCYKGKPGFESVGSGFNGPFDLLHEAIKQAASTKNYFNIEKERIERMPAMGPMEVTIRERVLDKAEVWIDEYKDGYFHQRLDEEGKRCLVQPKTIAEQNAEQSEKRELQPA